MKTMMRLMATSCLVAAATAAAPAWGQTAQDVPAVTGDPVADAKIAADEDLDASRNARADEIVVTGTRITRPNNKSAAPIISITSSDIEKQGATTIEEVLNRLPQVQPNAEQNYADSDGRQRVKLRSLGFERTLTLVDGLRLGIQNGLDVGIIPTTLVDRVDVLTGGASSVYGSDAVSGVVNFILKKNFDGLEITGGYSLYNHDNRANPVTVAAANANFPAPRGMTNDGGRANVTMSAGKTLFDGAFNITGFIGYRHSDVVPLGARSTAACEVTQPNRDGPLVCTPSTYTQAGTIIPRSGASNNQTLVNNPDGTRTFVPYGSGPNTRANPFDDFAFQREFNRINAGGFMTLTLSKAAEVYATMLAYRDRSQNPVPLRIYPSAVYGSTPYRVNCDNPYLSPSQARTLCGTNAGSATTAPLDLRYRFDGLPPAANRFENKGLRVTGGVRGRVLDDAWTYDVAGVYSSNRATTTYPAFPNFDRVNRTLNVVSVGGVPTCASVVSGADRACVPFNAFTAFNNDAAVTNYIFQSIDGKEFSKPTMWQGLATVSGDLGKYGITSPLAEQGIAVAFGVEYRAEKFVSGADAQFRLTNGGTDARFTQNVWEGNVEVQVPLVEKRSWTQLLQVNGGYRRSKYNRLNGAFDTWKGEALWAPIDDITFRGSINKAQAAPSLFQVVQAENITYTNTNGSAQDPCAAGSGQNGNPRASLAACRATGLPDNLYGSATLTCPDNACTIRGGGFGLTPETAYTKTFGVVVRPRFLPGLTLSVDRFLIDLKDSISFFSANDYIVGCAQTQDPYYCRGIVRNPGTFTLTSPAAGNPTTGFIIQGTTNGYKSKSHGWDAQAQWEIGLASAGKLNLSFNGTRMTRVGGQDAPNIAPRNCVGYYGPTCGESLPKWTHTMLTTYTPVDRSFSASVNWRYTGSQTVSYNASNAELGIPFTAADRRETYNGVKPYSYFDVALSFDVAKRMTLRLSVNNVFDKDPPLIPDSRSLLGLLRSNTMFRYDLLGRQLTAGATVRF